MTSSHHFYKGSFYHTLSYHLYEAANIRNKNLINVLFQFKAMLYIIGLGLNNEKDITLHGLEAIKKCSRIYIEDYTSVFNATKKGMERLYRKKIVPVDRGFVEDGTELIKEAGKSDIALLVIGDCFSATTHIALHLNAKRAGVKVVAIHNASVLTAVSNTGLSLYKFGAVASIPFENKEVISPYEILKRNKDLHTLFLLDLNPAEKRFMTINQAIAYLLRVSRDKDVFSEDRLCIGCCALGSDREVIRVGRAGELLKLKFDRFPQCLVVPGKLHFMEEEFLNSL